MNWLGRVICGGLLFLGTPAMLSAQIKPRHSGNQIKPMAKKAEAMPHKPACVLPEDEPWEEPPPLAYRVSWQDPPRQPAGPQFWHQESMRKGSQLSWQGMANFTDPITGKIKKLAVGLASPGWPESRCTQSLVIIDATNPFDPQHWITWPRRPVMELNLEENEILKITRALVDSKRGHLWVQVCVFPRTDDRKPSEKPPRIEWMALDVASFPTMKVVARVAGVPGWTAGFWHGRILVLNDKEKIVRSIEMMPSPSEPPKARLGRHPLQVADEPIEPKVQVVEDVDPDVLQRSASMAAIVTAGEVWDYTSVAATTNNCIQADPCPDANPDSIPPYVLARNRGAIARLKQMKQDFNGQSRDILVMHRDPEEWTDVGHFAVAVKNRDGIYVIILSQWPASVRGDPGIRNWANTNPHDLWKDEGGRPPTQGYMVNVPNFGAFSDAAIVELKKRNWVKLPRNCHHTHCTYSTWFSLKAGGATMPGSYPSTPSLFDRWLRQFANNNPGHGIGVADAEARSLFPFN